MLLVLFLTGGCGPRDEEPASRSDYFGYQARRDTAGTVEPGTVGQVIYVPAYSHIFYQDGNREFNLTTTLSIRNTDGRLSVTITDVSYFDSDGRLVRHYIDEPLTLRPLASKAYVVEERDKAGGVGANFIVEWHAEETVSTPIVEAVMISTANTQGISFVSRGEVIRSWNEGEKPFDAP